MLKQLTFGVEQFCKSHSFRKVNPLHITAYKSGSEHFGFVITRSKDKNSEERICVNDGTSTVSSLV